MLCFAYHLLFIDFHLALEATQPYMDAEATQAYTMDTDTSVEETQAYAMETDGTDLDD